VTQEPESLDCQGLEVSQLRLLDLDVLARVPESLEDSCEAGLLEAGLLEAGLLEEGLLEEGLLELQAAPHSSLAYASWACSSTSS